MINTRCNKNVVIDNGAVLKYAGTTITLGEFIPFYFGVRMPMLYVVQNGGNFIHKATPPEDVVYLVCSVHEIVKTKLSYYFSDGHATDNYTTFYGSRMINKLPDLIDWGAVKTAYWGGQENLDIKRKKQAEFLILGDIPPNLIVGFGCYNELANIKLHAMGISEGKIKVIPQAYF